MHKQLKVLINNIAGRVVYRLHHWYLDCGVSVMFKLSISRLILRPCSSNSNFPSSDEMIVRPFSNVRNSKLKLLMSQSPRASESALFRKVAVCVWARPAVKWYSCIVALNISLTSMLQATCFETQHHRPRSGEERINGATKSEMTSLISAKIKY